MSFMTGVKVVFATLLIVASMGMLIALEQTLAAMFPGPEQVMVNALLAVGGVFILWYGLFGPGFFGTGKTKR